MSGFDTNPFADPRATATNPFADQSVRQASQAGQRVETVEEFNPFAEDQYASQTRPVAAPQPAVLHTTYDPAPPPYSAPAAGGGHAGGADSDYLRARQEELERKAAELDRRERDMQANVAIAARLNNFPPLPSKCPVKPCFYQDFSVDIPAQFQRVVKANFYVWIAYTCVLFLNLWMSLAYFCVSASNGIDNQSGTTFGLSILYFCLWTPLSFICWFRAVYNAFRRDSSFFFFAFFFICLLQIVANIVQALGIDGSGSVGWISGFQMALSPKGGPKAMGIVMIVVGALFSVLAVLSVALLFRVHAIYRSSGASFQKAQEEFAQGIVSNRAVQQTAAGAASAAARGAMQQSFTGGDNRY